jgi:hypothetical protein
MTIWYSRVTPAGPILTLAEAKIHLKVVPTDTSKDADITAKLAEAQEYIFATLGGAADPSWDATSAPHVVRNAIKIALDAFMERRGGDEGGEDLRKALEVVDRLLVKYRDVSVA